MTIYTDARTTATNLLTTYGESITIETPKPVLDPVSGAVSGTVSTSTGYAVFTPYKGAKDDFLASGDMSLTSTAAVTIDDIIIRADGFKYQVIEIGNINPAGVSVVYTARVRGTNETQTRTIITAFNFDSNLTSFDSELHTFDSTL